MSLIVIPARGESRSLGARALRCAGAGILLLALALGAVSCKAKTEDQLLKEAEAQMQSRNILGATLLLQDFLKKYPQSQNATLARFKLAEAYALDKDFEKSRQTLDGIIELAGGRDNQTGLNATTLKLDTYVAEQKMTEALNEALLTSNSLKAIDPKLKSFFQTRIGDLYFMNQQADQAIAIYRAVINQSDLAPEWRVNAINGALNTYRGSNDAEGLEKFFSEYFEKHPQEPFRTRILSRVGVALILMGKADLAAKYLDMADQENNAKFEAAVGVDEKTQALYELAETQLARKNMAGSQDIFRRIINDYPTSKLRAQVIWALGQTQVEQGKLADGLASFEQIVREYPKTQEAYSAMVLTQRLKAAIAAAPTTATLTTDAATTAPLTSEGAATEPAPAGEAAPAPAGE